MVPEPVYFKPVQRLAPVRRGSSAPPGVTKKLSSELFSTNTNSRAGASAAVPTHWFADRFGRWDCVDRQVLLVAGEKFVAGNETGQSRFWQSTALDDETSLGCFRLPPQRLTVETAQEIGGCDDDIERRAVTQSSAAGPLPHFLPCRDV